MRVERLGTLTARTAVRIVLAGCCVLLAAAASAQEAPSTPEQQVSSDEKQGPAFVRFFAGAAVAFVAHESGHLTFDLLFDGDPRLKAVDFHGIPFFAITHRANVSPRQRFTIASAGFWIQHAGNEWLLDRRNLRETRAPVKKGMLAFNLLASTAYAGAAFARTGPDERDTRGMADGARVDERAIGALLVAPAALDTWRYFHPDAKWAVWLSRGVKIGTVLLVLR